MELLLQNQSLYYLINPNLTPPVFQGKENLQLQWYEMNTGSLMRWILRERYGSVGWGSVCLLQAWCLSAITNYLLRVTPGKEGLVCEVVKADLQSMEVVEQQLGNAAFLGVPPFSVLPLGRLATPGIC